MDAAAEIARLAAELVGNKPQLLWDLLQIDAGEPTPPAFTRLIAAASAVSIVERSS